MNILETNIETDRLRLVPISEQYREDIFREFTLEITKYMFPQPTGKIEDTDTFISTSIQKMKEEKEIVLSVLDKKTNEYLGQAALHRIDTEHPEFGVWLKKAAHGNAYGREAIQSLKKWADEHVDYEYITYPVDKKNIASRKVAESMGGTVVKEYKDVNQNGDELDEVEYHIYPKK